uniref:IGv domain-containing protein n=1 Tax=Caenorhabditis tropicalis TaxID=1561998 RepID=A0A1I7TIR4_9PELO
MGTVNHIYPPSLYLEESFQFHLNARVAFRQNEYNRPYHIRVTNEESLVSALYDTEKERGTEREHGEVTYLKTTHPLQLQVGTYSCQIEQQGILFGRPLQDPSGPGPQALLVFRIPKKPNVIEAELNAPGWLWSPKGSRSDPSNYRPISLTSSIRKTMEKMIKKKVVKYLRDDIRNPQAGLQAFARHLLC